MCGGHGYRQSALGCNTNIAALKAAPPASALIKRHCAGLWQPLRGPYSELRASERLHPIPYRDDDIQVVVVYLSFHAPFALLLNLSEFPTVSRLLQFPLFIHIAYMLCYGAPPLAKQLCHLRLREPHGVFLQPHLYLQLPVIGLVEEDFAGHGLFVWVLGGNDLPVAIYYVDKPAHALQVVISPALPVLYVVGFGH
jgi:hypothetical protein